MFQLFAVSMLKRLPMLSVCLTISLTLVVAGGKSDYYELAVQWPPGVCFQAEPPCRVQPDSWTILGFRARNSDDSLKCTEDIASCVLDLSELHDDLKLEMEEKWPSLLKETGSNEEYWEDEYCIYGTSFSNIAQDYPPQYFRSAIRLLNKLDIGRAFHPTLMSPHFKKNPARKTLEEALFNTLGVRVKLSCKEDRAGRQLLMGLRVCYTELLDLMDCPGWDTDLRLGCDGSKDVFLASLALNQNDRVASDDSGSESDDSGIEDDDSDDHVEL